MADAKQQVHIVLVHGIGHGAWCWYKLQPLLEAAGHGVTVLDLAASGIDRRNLEDLHTFIDYSQPLLDLMASIPPEEKVLLVGHSLGGMNLAFAMDMYPEKIKVAVFLTALMPDTTNKPSYVAEKDVALANTLVRPGSLFLPDLSNRSPFSNEGYGSVKRVFILCLNDKVIPIKFQRWQIENFAPDQVKKIDNSDHMVMISKPQDVSQRLFEIIADYYD
ncbi:UNVERIFIED_CONTAM: Polyneuridine-aldehyde esterase [Sesamum latifolium]|uniref:Polyneuridine-aldehyde esterase n=1 Tax=Sesamum latifolium TaxID=2727402 RepID=A0AAW2XBB0_9LAMI